MEKVLNYKVLVAEENSIVNYEIQHQLKKSGFHIIEKAKNDNFANLVETNSPDYTITCVGLLMKSKASRDLTKLISMNNMLCGSTDTIIFDNNMNPLIKYPKPFDSNEIINFIIKHLNINPKLNNHESNN